MALLDPQEPKRLETVGPDRQVGPGGEQSVPELATPRAGVVKLEAELTREPEAERPAGHAGDLELAVLHIGERGGVDRVDRQPSEKLA